MTPGLLIGKQYRLTRQLGSGAMGVVWAAVNEKTGREVALKLILRSTEELRHRLLREARACGALQHRNIVDVYDVGQTEEGDPFLVMQLLNGETLADRLARQRRLDPPDAAQVARDVARALEAAHGANIIHRDLKPANIFLHREAGSDGTVVKVLDFGVSKNLAASDGLSTIAGAMVGSPAYMSPEQSAGAKTIDHRTDVWSLGIVLFEMLSGQRPFQGDHNQIMVKIAAGEVPLVSRYVRRIDDGLVQVVARCLERDPSRRIPTAKDLADRLEQHTGAAPPRSVGASPVGADSSGGFPRVEPGSGPVPGLMPDPGPRSGMPSSMGIDPATRSPRMPGLVAAPTMPGADDDGDLATAKLDPRVLGAMARSGPAFGSSPHYQAVPSPQPAPEAASAHGPLRPMPMPGAPGTVPLAPQSELGMRPPTRSPFLATQPLANNAPPYGNAAAANAQVTTPLQPAPNAWQSPLESQHAAFDSAARAPMQSGYDHIDPNAPLSKHGTVRISPDLMKNLPPPTAGAAGAPPAPPPPDANAGAHLTLGAVMRKAYAEEAVDLPVRRTGLYVVIGIGAFALVAIVVGLVLMLGKTASGPAPARSGAEVTVAVPSAPAPAASAAAPSATAPAASSPAAVPSATAPAASAEPSPAPEVPSTPTAEQPASAASTGPAPPPPPRDGKGGSVKPPPGGSKGKTAPAGPTKSKAPSWLPKK